VVNVILKLFEVIAESLLVLRPTKSCAGLTTGVQTHDNSRYFLNVS